MIKTRNLVPSIYYDKSRDFQLLGRTYDLIFNYIKNNSDMVSTNQLSENSDPKLIDLVATTLGFKKAHEYNINELVGLCSIFSKALRNKGNITSIEYILNLLAHVNNISDPIYTSFNVNDPYLLEIYLPIGIVDTSLLEDVLNYILPAGMTYRIIKQALIQGKAEDMYKFTDSYKPTISKVIDMSKIIGLWDTTIDLPQNSDVKPSRIDNATIPTLPPDE